MDKRFLLILAALVVLIGGVVWFNKSKSPQSSNAGNQANASNHTEGKNSKAVTLVEYGDYQCPVCGQYYPIVKQVVASHIDDISFRFANFPLVQIHQNAMAAARAAEAASLQGKFWEMHDQLYENQSSWSNTSNPSQFFDQYARLLGLDMNKFHADQASSAVLATINADVAQAQAAGGTGTPTFVLNGKTIATADNPRSVDDFNKLLDDAIKNAKH